MTNAPTTRTSTPTGSPPTSNGGATDRAASEAHNVVDTGKHGAGRVADEAGSQAAELARTARLEARHRADGEVGKLAGFLSGLANELDGVAEGSPPQGGHLQGLARDGARAADRLSQRLETDGLDGALHDVSMFARRRPGVFLAAAFGVGIALGRVTRNADMQSISREMQRDEDSLGENGTESTRSSTLSTLGSTPPVPGVRP